MKPIELTDLKEDSQFHASTIAAAFLLGNQELGRVQIRFAIASCKLGSDMMIRWKSHVVRQQLGGTTSKLSPISSS